MIWLLAAGFALTLLIYICLTWRHRNNRVNTSTSVDRTVPLMQPCPVCGNSVVADWEFCPFCGRAKPRPRPSNDHAEKIPTALRE